MSRDGLLASGLRRLGAVPQLLRRLLPVRTHTTTSRGHISDARTGTTLSRKQTRLCNTFFLALPADEALAALHNLTLERFALEFVTIPAYGGCVVAVFAPVSESGVLLGRFRRAREQQSVTSLLASIGATTVSSSFRGFEVSS